MTTHRPPVGLARAGVADDAQVGRGNFASGIHLRLSRDRFRLPGSKFRVYLTDRTTGVCLKAVMALGELCRQAGEQWEKVMMTIRETLASIRYVMNANGERTDVLIPLASWKAILASWKQMIELLEDQEDSAILRDWLEKRAAGETDTIILDSFVQSLGSERADWAQ
jgi:hypothetical protein